MYKRQLQDVRLHPPKQPTLPEVDDDHYNRRLQYQHKQRLVQIIRRVVADHLPRGAVVAVLSQGDPQMLNLGPLTCWHYPQTPDGKPVAGDLRSSEEAIESLEALRARGASYLLVPATSAWWWLHYQEWSSYLHTKHHLVSEHQGVMTLFALRAQGGDDVPVPVSYTHLTLPTTPYV